LILGSCHVFAGIASTDRFLVIALLMHRWITVPECMLEALQKIWEFLFGCWHGRLSRPFTISGDTYKVCLNCGRKLTYSLDTMSIIRRGTL